MESFPIFLNIKNKPITVIGGGDIALRKVKLLIKVKPKITLISKVICKELKEMLLEHNHKIIKKSFQEKDLENPILIVAATNNTKLNKKISIIAQQKNILINVVDQPELCTFTMGSIIERDSLVISISSGGKAPVLVRSIREKIEMLIPQSYSELVKFAGNLRSIVKKKIQSGVKRRVFWEDFFKSDYVQNFILTPKKLNQRLFNKILSGMKNKRIGEVYLVGAGPGERDLLTIRALHLMQKCDVCIYDNLVSKDILEMVRRDADIIYAGKKQDQHTLSQDKINILLIKFAKQGKRVLRLKGGDPFIFGRGGEEIESLMKNKISFQVVPGITAANGIASYSGIPLTHRDHAQSCLFLTGHLKDGALDFDWPKLIINNQTIVIYMGLLSLKELVDNLLQHGMLKKMPIAIIESGTTSKQKVIIGMLSNIKPKVEKAKIKSPALIIIGKVVSLRNKLNWFK
ncbi:MAG: uroporphyrinogen-III C-methyltransferase [Nitrosomonadales bacterium]|nr:uroporphyrinogen-III C-methyltransferase [Nitrosomonadales bacterium]|tara:strand:+ start:1286 stop:2662 length:1377 start_codon:yes stop_codon:yes gene_type:complete